MYFKGLGCCLGNCRYSCKLAVRVCRAKALPIADYIGLKVNLNPSRRITGDWYPFAYPVGIVVRRLR
jgi:hypothetical protein